LVNNKLRIDSTCSGTCTFTYVDEASSPLLSSISPSTITSGDINLTGERFDAGSTCEAVLVNRVTGVTTVLTPSSCTPTGIVAPVAGVESGYYFIKARTDDIGESNGEMVTVGAAVTTVVPTSLSIHGGQVTIQGNGLPSTWPSTHYNDFLLTANSKSFTLDVVSSSATELVINLPAVTASTEYVLTIKSPSGSIRTAMFSQTTAATPTVTVVSPTTASASGVVSVQLNRTASPSAEPEIVQVYSISNPDSIQTITAPTFGASTIDFDVTLKSGRYGFKLYDDVYGWYTSGDFIDVSKTGAYTVADFTTSFNGGQVVVSGADISEGATVTVNGQVGTFVSSTATDAIFSVPPLVTPSTQAAFKLRKN